MLIPHLAHTTKDQGQETESRGVEHHEEERQTNGRERVDREELMNPSEVVPD